MNDYATSVVPLEDWTWQGILFCNGMTVATTARYPLKAQAQRAVDTLLKQWKESEKDDLPVR